MAPLGFHDLLKIKIYRENAKIANIFLQYDTIKQFIAFRSVLYVFFFIVKR